MLRKTLESRGYSVEEAGDAYEARRRLAAAPFLVVLTDLPLGCWTSASIVDVVGGRSGRSAATRLVALGLLSAGPTAYAGLASWSRLEGEDRRVGAVHAIGNDVAIVLFAGSLLARARGQHGRGVRLALLATWPRPARGTSAATSPSSAGPRTAHERGDPRPHPR